MSKIYEIWADSGEVVVSDLTEEEIAIKEAAFLEEKQNKLNAEIAKANAKAALLDRLGITEEEAKLLLG